MYGIFSQVITVILLWFFLGVQGHWYSAQCLLGMKLMGGEVCLPRIYNHAYTSELNRCMLRLIPRTHLSNYVEKLIQLMKNGDVTVICCIMTLTIMFYKLEYHSSLNCHIIYSNKIVWEICEEASFWNVLHINFCNLTFNQSSVSTFCVAFQIAFVDFCNSWKTIFNQTVWTNVAC